MREHFDSVSLKAIANHFSYHPNYISALPRRETDLPIYEIAARLGYSNSSNFYKAFREHFHVSPGEYLSRDSEH